MKTLSKLDMITCVQRFFKAQFTLSNVVPELKSVNIFVAHSSFFVGLLVLFLLDIVICRDEYTDDGKFYKTDSGLLRVPEDIPMAATGVYLNSNLITTIKSNAFIRLSQCQILVLQSNFITNVENDAFNGLRNLKELNLQGNRILRVRTNMFSHLEQCEELNLYDNKVATVEPKAFIGLDNLKVLWLSVNQITELGDDVFIGLGCLQQLYLDRNKLITVNTNTFSHLPRPLQFVLTYPELEGNNPLICDSRMCWLKQEENDGTITWYRDPRHYKPECANSLVWATWYCSGIGWYQIFNKYESRPPLAMVTM